MQSNPKPQFITREDGANIAYHATPGKNPEKKIGVVFLGGFRSDMEGSKALALETWCRSEGRAYLRFDYYGHGQSSGAFEDGCIGRWADDALFALDRLTDGPQVLVGSSMGGWLMLLTARARAERVKGLVGLAAAPDFTEDLMWNELTADQRDALARDGVVHIPNDYDPSDPYTITRKLIEDGKNHLLLRESLNIQAPVRLIQGMRDADVPWKTALAIQDALVSDDVEIQFVKTGDHRLSTDPDLKRLTRTVDALLNDLESEDA
ncbi:MAG: alpha/beta hydrolase [Alphaproteobacteria bacterium]|nr:alpha/beta hydrolase [Alphaproteobacteria bacterium]MBF0250918.1 alpha/beta hydrolase [Alphaproteobacteria bacterium]